MAAARDRRILGAGAQAPDFQLPELAGGSQNLSGLLAKGPVVLAFFKVTCPTCQFTFPFLERMHRQNVPFVAISQDDDESTREFNAEFGISFPALLDDPDAYPASNAYGIGSVPSLFLIEPDGRIGWSSEGFRRRELESLGRRFNVQPFQPGDYVPEWKAG
ncbi:MAG: TlpA disulfide reductase family protein [Bryobacteraceae bacterium]